MNQLDTVDGKNPGKDSSESGLTILTIDDVREAVSSLEEWLTAHGHRVFTALSGEQGLEILEEHKVDVVLCDLHMPGMNGWEVARALQEMFGEDSTRKPPFILVTGSASHFFHCCPISRSGIAAVVQKPVDTIKLLVVINEVVEQHTQGELNM